MKYVSIRPTYIYLQWHITERCNWHCKHCYQEEDYIKDELTTEQLLDVINQYISLIKICNISHDNARLSLTGGEPLISKDVFKLAKELGKYSHIFSWGMVSNGSLLTKEIVKRLKKCNIKSYKLSFEGMEKNNDDLRGKGAFRKTLNSIKLLADEGITIHATLILTKKNRNDIQPLAELLAKMGVSDFGIGRFVPNGRGSALREEMLQPQELFDHYEQVKKINKQLRDKNIKLQITHGCESGIFNSHLNNKEDHRFCSLIYNRMLTVMPNGDVYPCRRLPIKVGNVLKESLSDIYLGSDKLLDLRNINNAHPFCQKCSNFNKCYGGAKCAAYAYSGKLFVPDVQCPKAYKELKEPSFFDKFKDYVKKDRKFAENP